MPRPDYVEVFTVEETARLKQILQTEKQPLDLGSKTLNDADAVLLGRAIHNCRAWQAWEYVCWARGEGFDDDVQRCLEQKKPKRKEKKKGG